MTNRRRFLRNSLTAAPARTFDVGGLARFCIQVYFAMEQIGWDGR